MKRFKFIAVLDADEVIIPMKPEDYTWHDLMKRFDHNKGYTSILPNNVIMPDLGSSLHFGIPSYHHMLQHTMVRILWLFCYKGKEE